MITYGYSVKEGGDPYVEVVEAAVNGFSESLEPGAFLVDLIPARKLWFLCPRTGGDANHGYPSVSLPSAPRVQFTRNSTSPSLVHEQYDTCLTGSQERSGKSRASDSQTC